MSLPVKQCVVCGSDFTVRPGKIEAARIYCSHRCANQRPTNIPERTCEHCGKSFRMRVYKNQPARFCSQACHNDHRRVGHVKRGYVLVRTGGPQVPVHRLIAAQSLRRPLTPDEHVHHINGITTDNAPENLLVLSRSEHMKLEAKIRAEKGTGHRFPCGPANPKWKDGRRAKRDAAGDVRPADVGQPNR